MKLRHLSIRNFRAIRELEWTIESDVACLVGPGDGCKTSILDAIEYTLYASWPLAVSDADFPESEPDQEIAIQVTVSPIPDTVKKEESLHGSFREWRDGEVHDEPNGSGELAVTIQLKVDEALEAEWRVVSDRDPEGVPLRARARAALGMTRLTEDPDPHLGWKRGSDLVRLAPSDSDAGRTLTEVYRQARQSIATETFDTLTEVVEQVERTARRYGAGPATEDLQVRMDSSRGSFRASVLGLASDEVPLTRAGLGSRRLLAAAIQARSVPDGAIMLVDEIEHGLEPHRLKGLLQLLQGATGSTASESETSDDGDLPALGQVIVTSHSPTAISELAAENIHIVRRQSDGHVEVRRFNEELQGLVRSQPEALLGRKIIICEGSTEVGICRSLESQWISTYGEGAPLSHLGVVVVNGSGTNAALTAKRLADLKYPALLLADADVDIDPTAEELSGIGAEVVQWADGLCTEQRLAADLPIAAIEEMIRYAEETWGRQVVSDAVRYRLKKALVDIDDPLEGDSILDWMGIVDEEAIRQAFGDAAANSGKNRDGWFKRIDHGEHLGQIIKVHWYDLEDTDLNEKLTRVGAWAYADHS